MTPEQIIQKLTELSNLLYNNATRATDRSEESASDRTVQYHLGRARGITESCDELDNIITELENSNDR